MRSIHATPRQPSAGAGCDPGGLALRKRATSACGFVVVARPRCGHRLARGADCYRCEQHDVACFAQEPTGCESCDLLTGSKLGAEVELLDRLAGTKPSGPNPELGTGRVPCYDLPVEHCGEVLLVGPAGVAGMVGKPTGCFGDPGRLQRAS